MKIPKQLTAWNALDFLNIQPSIKTVNLKAEERKQQAKDGAGIVTANLKQLTDIEAKREKARQEVKNRENYEREERQIMSLARPGTSGQLSGLLEFVGYSTPGYSTLMFADDASKHTQLVGSAIKNKLFGSAIGNAIKVPADIAMGAVSLIPFTGSLTRASEDIANVPKLAHSYISGKLDQRFNNVIMPEHIEGINFLNDEVIPGRLGRKLTDIEKSRLFYENVDRYRMFGKDRTPLKYWIQTDGYASDDGAIRYNPLRSQKKYAPTAVHEGLHQVLFLRPAVSFGTEEVFLPLSNTTIQKAKPANSFKFARLFDPDTGVWRKEANFDPYTGEFLGKPFNYKTDLEIGIDLVTGRPVVEINEHPVTKRKSPVDKRRNEFTFYDVREPDPESHVFWHRDFVDPKRQEILSMAYPVQETRYGPILFGDASSSLERDATNALFLYELSRQARGAKGVALNHYVRTLPSLDLLKTLPKINGYGNSYGIGVSSNLRSGTITAEELADLIRRALLHRKHGGTLSYLNYINN